MRMAIIGGRLQGLEASYLARKAGWETLVIDRRLEVPAAGVCDAFVRADAASPRELDAAMEGVDLILPAMEDPAVLQAVTRWSSEREVPLAFDLEAFSLSASKILSDRLFQELALPRPAPWPGCGFPLIAKPDRGSGSKDVRVYCHPGELEAEMPRLNATGQWVFQELLDGPSYSLEVIGANGCYHPFQATDLEMDPLWDCKRVLAPTELPDTLVAELERTGVALARSLRLRGIMDVEVILHNGQLKVLEIDARLPSQTPTAVFWSTGLNMVALLAELYLNPQPPSAVDLPPPEPLICGAPKGVVYEHIQVEGGALRVAGEHVIASAGRLHLDEGFFGATEALTNYGASGDHWVATLIVVGETREEALVRREEVIRSICQREGITTCSDPGPSR